MTSNHPGLGVMIKLLGGNQESVTAYKKAVGKKIVSLCLDKEADALRFRFEDGYKMRIFDGGQSCCEERYMTTDDKLEDFIGSEFLEAKTQDAPDIEDDGDAHEVQFLIIKTSKGEFTCENHNKHNGYYGGFYIELAEET